MTEFDVVSMRSVTVVQITSSAKDTVLSVEIARRYIYREAKMSTHRLLLEFDRALSTRSMAWKPEGYLSPSLLFCLKN